MPGGATLTDVSMKNANCWLRDDLAFRALPIRTVVISDHRARNTYRRNDLLATDFLAAVLEKIGGNQ